MNTNDGVSFERKHEYIPGDCTIKPLGDRIFVRPLDWDPSRIITAIREGRPVRGEAVAVGPGTYRRKYNKDRSKTWLSKVFIPTTVKPGDIVEWGGLNIFDGKGYSFQEVIHGTERLLVITERDVCFINESHHGST
jgi:co-chaperonin GroES (HSP10)